jgi:hypothetical protein
VRAFFDWSQYPEISTFVKNNYTANGPKGLAGLIASKFGVHLQPHQVRKRWRVLSGANAEFHRKTRAADKETVAAPDYVFQNQNAAPDFDRIGEMFDAAMEEVERKEADHLGQTQLSVNFASSKLPIGICFTGDWQIGTNGVMMRQLRQDTAAIAAADGLYSVLMGDLAQNLNMVKHPSSMHEMTLTDPQDQFNCVRLIIHEMLRKAGIDPLDPRILAAVTGNHEHNSKKAAGIDPTAGFCKEFNIPYLWHGGRVDVTLGSTSYVLGIRHLYQGESGVNTTNAQRMMYHNWLPADVEVLGHRHYNDLQKRPMPGRDTIFLRSGSYQMWDDHGQFVGGYKGSWGIPLIVLFPDQKRIIPFYGNDFYLGLEFLADQRRRYQDKQG